MSRTFMFLSLALAACGPSVSEVRMIAAPGKAENCDLEFLQLQMTDVAPGGKYEVLGHVILGESGVQDPLQPKYKEEVRPRACAMGGEGVAILMQASSQGGFGQSGTSIDYAVVRKAQAPGAPQAPSKF